MDFITMLILSAIVGGAIGAIFYLTKNKKNRD